MYSSLSLFAIYRVPDQVFLHGSKYMKHTFIGAHFFSQINIFVFTFVHESISTLDIKFFTLSLELLQNMPVVLLTALISNIYFASQLFYNNEPNNNKQPNNNQPNNNQPNNNQPYDNEPDNEHPNHRQPNNE